MKISPEKENCQWKWAQRCKVCIPPLSYHHCPMRTHPPAPIQVKVTCPCQGPFPSQHSQPSHDLQIIHSNMGSECCRQIRTNHWSAEVVHHRPTKQFPFHSPLITPWELPGMLSTTAYTRRCSLPGFGHAEAPDGTQNTGWNHCKARWPASWQPKPSNKAAHLQSPPQSPHGTYQQAVCGRHHSLWQSWNNGLKSPPTTSLLCGSLWFWLPNHHHLRHTWNLWLRCTKVCIMIAPTSNLCPLPVWCGCQSQNVTEVTPHILLMWQGGKRCAWRPKCTERSPWSWNLLRILQFRIPRGVHLELKSVTCVT